MKHTVYWFLRKLWRNPRMAAVVVTVAAVLFGLAVARTMPRGSTTTAQTLIVMATSLILGGLAGIILKSRWAMLIAPIAYIIAIEVGQFNLIGPTVDAIRLDEPFGILALILGRGFHGLVGILPMIIGCAWGIAIANQLMSITSSLKPGRWTIAATVGLLILAIWIALPGSTPPIPGGSSIASLEKVQLGGKAQWIMLRGRSQDKPVLLYLSGGPGQSDLPFSRVLFD
ncbi:MAG: hypothetical protein MUC48_18625, partial [Leptolyngbya sp. Prado105]|nr:hypothetical protein [Leptolyngbya sp. Prado105]